MNNNLYLELINQYKSTSIEIEKLIKRIEEKKIVYSEELGIAEKSIETLKTLQNNLIDFLNMKETDFVTLNDLEVAYDNSSISSKKEFVINELNKFEFESNNIKDTIINNISSLENNDFSTKILNSYISMFELYNSLVNKKDLFSKSEEYYGLVDPMFFMGLACEKITLKKDVNNDESNDSKVDNEDSSEQFDTNEQISLDENNEDKEEIIEQVSEEPTEQTDSDKDETEIVEDENDSDQVNEKVVVKIKDLSDTVKDLAQDIAIPELLDYYNHLNKYDIEVISNEINNVEIKKKLFKFNKSSFLSSKDSTLDRAYSHVLANLYTNGFVYMTDNVTKNDKLVLNQLFNNGYLYRINSEKYGLVYYLSEIGYKIFDIYQIQKLIERQEKINIKYNPNQKVMFNDYVDEENIEDSFNLIKLFNYLNEKFVLAQKEIKTSIITISHNISFNNKEINILYLGKSLYSLFLQLATIPKLKKELLEDTIIVSDTIENAISKGKIVSEYFGDSRIKYFMSIDNLEEIHKLDGSVVSFDSLFEENKDEKPIDIETTNETSESEVDEITVDDIELEEENKLSLINKLKSEQEDTFDEEAILSELNEVVNAREIAEVMIKNNYFTDEVNQKIINQLLLENRFDVCLVLLKELGNKNETYKKQYDLLSCATGNSSNNYDTSLLRDNFEQIFGEMNDFELSCFAATIIRILFRPAMQHDYNLDGWYRNFKTLSSDIQYFNVVKKIANILSEELEKECEGFSKDNLLQFKDNKNIQEEYQKLRERSKGFTQKRQFTFKDHGLFSKCIGDQSEILTALQYVISDDATHLDVIKKQVNKYLDNNDFLDSKIIEDLRSKNASLRSNQCSLNNINEKEVVREYKNRLNCCKEYISLKEGKSTDFKESLKHSKELLEDAISEYRNRLDLTVENNIINNTFEYILNEFNNVEENNSNIKEFLLTENVTLDESLEVDTKELPYYTLYYRTIKHISEYNKPEDYQETLCNILDKEQHDDNIGFIYSVQRYLNNNDITIDFDFDLIDDYKASIRNQISETFQELTNKIDLYSMYGRLTDKYIEELYANVDKVKEFFENTLDLKLLKECIDSINKEIQIEVRKRKDEYCELFEKAITNKSLKEYPIINDIYEAIKQENLTVADEYLKWLSNDKKEVPMDQKIQDNYFLEYVRVYEKIYDMLGIVHGKPLRSKAESLVIKLKDLAEKELNIEKRRKNTTQAEQIINCWPKGLEGKDGFKDNKTNIVTLFQALQFDVDEISEIQKVKDAYYRNIKIRKIGKQLPEYFHPISAFGTDIQEKTPVVYLEGNHNAQDINNFMTKEFNYEGFSIVLLDWDLPLAERRKLAYYFKTSGTLLHKYLVIDRVLLIYLAMIIKSERQRAFIKCILPFTYVQPFAESGVGRIPDEMFYGRTKELNSIIDIMNGSNLVYGGRQLGKTALLQRVQNLMMKPEEKCYTIYMEVLKKKKSSEVLEILLNKIFELQDDIGKSILISKSKAKEIKNWSDFASAIKVSHNRDEFNKLYILIDEADEFIAEQENENYEAINQLINLKDDAKLKGKFKFVLAGLHNVARFINNKDNDCIRKLGTPLCIKPLDTNDAKRFIIEPLSCIGYSFSNPDQQIAMILSKLNYYPGLLHVFCSKIVKSTNHEYSEFFKSEVNPPYTIDDKVLGKLLTDNEINNEVVNKLSMTLDLSGSLYSKIACAISYSYEYDGKTQGLTVDEIKVFFPEGYETKKIQALLEEMIELSVLTKNDYDGVVRYFYKKFSFHKLMVKEYDKELLEEALKDYEK